MKQNKTLPIILCVIVGLVIIAAGVALLAGSDKDADITNFDDCVAAGNPVMESFPEQCRTPDGRMFVNERQKVEDEPLRPSSAEAGRLRPAEAGGQTDEHGCRPPAGYSYDEEIGACTRSWEIESDDHRRAASLATDQVGKSKGLTVIEVLPASCPGCFIVRLEKGEAHPKERMSVTIDNWAVSDLMTEKNEAPF